MKRKTESNLIDELKARTERKFGLKKTAAELSVSPQFICEVVRGRRGVTKRLAEAMGYRLVIEFEKLSGA